MKWPKFLALVMTFLGISTFAEKDGKKVLTDEQKQKIKAEMGDDFAMKLEKGLADNPDDEKAPDVPESQALALMQKQLEAANAEKTRLEGLVGTYETEKTANAKTITDLQANILELQKKPEPEPTPKPVTKMEDKFPVAVGQKFLGDQQVSYMALDDAHPYNIRAHASLLARQGYHVVSPTASSMDYSSLSSDLGAYYRVRKQERLQSFVAELPSLTKIFPLESGYQDQAVLVNVFMDDFSQADNTTSSTFSNVVKGGYTFQPETITMYDVMFAHKFTQLKQLEKQWIGYLNREGSDVMKWSFIEFILVETAKKLKEEQERRWILGIRKNPTANVAGLSMEASNGLLKFIKAQIALFKIKEFALGEWTPSNIVEYVFNGTMMIPAWLRDSGRLRCYMSTDAKIYYDRNFETLYGPNSNYNGPEDRVKFIQSIPIVAVPNMGESKRIIWTLDGNIVLLEDQPGEMLKFNLEQEDWSLKVWSNWKESVWAYMVGKKFASADLQDYDHQMIFCNDVDMPSTYFLPMVADDTTPSVLNHTSLVSVANTGATAITDIDDCSVGQEVCLKCGNATNSITIAASGKFSLLTAAWQPGVGEMIYLKKRSDGKFIELKRIESATDAIEFTADDVTPSVSAGTDFITVANTGATAITNLDNASYNVVYTIYGGSNTNSATIANAGNFVLTAAMTLSLGTYIKLQKSEIDNKFYEITRG